MHCPHCHAEPPRDPFICTSCGQRLLTYLDEPLGPGTGVRADELGGVGAGAPRELVGAGVAAGSRDDDNRPWVERQIDPTPPANRGRPAPARPAAPPPKKPADVTGSRVVKILFGLLVAVVLMIRWPLGGLLTIGLAAVLLWRWPRMPFMSFASATIAAGAALWVLVEIGDAMSTPPFVPRPTPTVQRAFATSTPIRPVSTPTVGPAAQSATATAGTGDTRALVARARARWLRGDNQTALNDLDRALALTPNDGNALNMRALVRVALGDYGGATDDAYRAVNTNPSSGTYHDTYGYALLKLKRYQDAHDEYLKALTVSQTIDPTASRLGMGLAFIGLGRLAEAAINIGSGVEKLPDVDPDPQLADLEASARQAIPLLPPSPYLPSPVPSPSASPAASPAALRDTGTVPGRAP
jgi:Tfp pilus assembly protein PilF